MESESRVTGNKRGREEGDEEVEKGDVVGDDVTKDEHERKVELERKTVVELKEILRSYKLHISGRKVEIVNRILDHEHKANNEQKSQKDDKQDDKEDNKEDNKQDNKEGEKDEKEERNDKTDKEEERNDKTDEEEEKEDTQDREENYEKSKRSEKTERKEQEEETKDLTEEDKKHIKDFEEAVNMTGHELEDWLKTDKSESVGQKTTPGAESIGHESGRYIVELLHKKHNKSGYTQPDIKQMQRVVSYVHRHMAQEPSGDITETRWRYSLMNWGHDPLKRQRN